jgi:hypothetical protein
MSTSAHPVGPSSQADGLLMSITLELSPIRRLLILDLADDPTYRTLEPQVLDDSAGDLLVLLAYRHDGHVELYVPSGQDVDRAGYDGLGKGLLGIHHGVFEHARFEVADDGLQLDLALTVSDGRRFDLHLHEHLTGPRDRFAALAPVGGAFDTPAFFPFLWLPGMSFVPVRGTTADVRVDGQARNIPGLPLPIGGRRCVMARYDPDVLVCQLSPDSRNVPAQVPAQATRDPHRDGVDVVEVQHGHGIAAVRVGRGGHTCAALFDPPLPDLQGLPARTRRSGSILLQADHTTELRGRYELARSADQVELVLEGFGPWRTRTHRPLLAVLFRLPVFRRWPTTYRWQATLDLTATAKPRLASRWSRCAAG